MDEAPPSPPGDVEVDGQSARFNALVREGAADAGRRTRWLAQMCEYWPLERLCAASEAELVGALEDGGGVQSPPSPGTRKGRILLVGAGPGHPDLLTLASHKALQRASLVLADKLVPSGVLALIPRRTPIFIAKKYPGNAEAAQTELLARGLAALQAGETVVRLKQGDPYIYGRGGEEWEFFSARGYTPLVLPGLTSALTAALVADIPATQRGVSDQVLVCTGTGRRGEAPKAPEWVETRTTVFLMALHRLGGLVAELGERGWPAETECAVVERASCGDQRVVRSTLRHVARAVEELGSRPPGLLVVGRACSALKGGLGGREWSVEEGFGGFE